MYGFTWDEDEPAPAPLTLKRYRIRFWHGEDGNWYDEDVLATSEAQCRALADKECPPEYRVRHASVGDSLQIIVIADATLPYFLNQG